MSGTALLACGVCTFSMFDRVMPPVFGWMLLSAGWFVAVSALFSWFGIERRGIPRIAIALVLTFFLGLLAMAQFGPVPLLPLAVLAGLATFRAFRPNPDTASWPFEDWPATGPHLTSAGQADPGDKGCGLSGYR